MCTLYDDKDSGCDTARSPASSPSSSNTLGIYLPPPSPLTTEYAPDDKCVEAGSDAPRESGMTDKGYSSVNNWDAVETYTAILQRLDTLHEDGNALLEDFVKLIRASV